MSFFVLQSLEATPRYHLVFMRVCNLPVLSLRRDCKYVYLLLLRGIPTFHLL